MKELLINQLAPIAATAVVAILVAVIKTVGDVVIVVLAKKKEEIEQKIKASGHEEELNTAKEVWNIIEEKFRITENAETLLSSKADEFNKLLLQKIPGLSQENIDDLRQAIAGEFNAGKEAVLNKSDVLKELQEANSKLKSENTEINNRLKQAQVVISTSIQS